MQSMNLNNEGARTHIMLLDIESNYHAHAEIEKSRYQKELDINKKIVLFGKYLTEGYFAPFQDEMINASVNFFKNAVEHRHENEDYYLGKGLPAPYSEEAISHYKSKLASKESISEREYLMQKRIFEEYLLESKYYHAAMEFFNY